MTDAVKTPEEIAAEAAVAAQGASVSAPAPEAAKDPAAAPDPAAADEKPPETPEEAAAEFEDTPVELLPGQTLTALRGVQAGPDAHPRTTQHAVRSEHLI